MDPKEINVNLFALISMLASACWQHLGKMPSQTEGEVIKDLEGAKNVIGMLLMLKDKMAGNLTKTEEKLLNDTISALQRELAQESAEDDTL